MARALNDRIVEAHKTNAKFKAAFADFFELCKNSLNPNLRREAVDEMLVQHLLTERLFRTVFDNPDFTDRNVIAVEIERVIGELASQSFSRADFLRKLDHFYKAIEDAARGLEDWSEKQHFLNTVYERFFQGYSVKVADTHGIVYTPQEIVDFMCASVEEVLKTEFGLGLGDPGVNILDPCTGTGNFIVNLMRRIPKKDLPRMYREQLFANEVMLLPYYIAAMNIEHAYFELTGQYEPFPGLCFVDTLELAEGAQRTLSFMTVANTARVERQKKAPITVIVGNPPYNMNQQNENDNNKNRKYPVVDNRIRTTYGKDSRATLNNKLYDPYVKFFRWATDRLELPNGIVCFVSNNSFVDQIAFDGMRKHLCQDFGRICHVDLHGNVRRNPKLSGTTHNVFGIQVGVGVTAAIRSSKHDIHQTYYHRVPEGWRKEQKLKWLAEKGTMGHVIWDMLTPDDRHNWLPVENIDEFERLIPIGNRDAKAASNDPKGVLFRVYSPGVNTARDNIVYSYHPGELEANVSRFFEDYNSEVDRYGRKGHGENIDDFVDYSRVKWSSTLKMHCAAGRHAEYQPQKIRAALYRPYNARLLYYESISIDRMGLFRRILPSLDTANEIICISGVGSSKDFQCLMTCRLPSFDLLDKTPCFPFHVYDEDGSSRRENVTEWALCRFRTQYSDPTISKRDIFHYVYGVLHHPGYRSRFADNLKRELPRIPLLGDFRALAESGKRLSVLHLGYEKVEPWPLEWVYSEGMPLSYSVEKMKLSKDKTELKINESLTLAKIPPQVFLYRLGNRSALEWVIDQYQVSTDKRSGITSDPNRRDDPEYIVRLVGQVVRVSMETVALIENLPPWPPSPAAEGQPKRAGKKSQK